MEKFWCCRRSPAVNTRNPPLPAKGKSATSVGLPDVTMVCITRTQLFNW